MIRILTGAIALLLFFGGGAMYFFQPDADPMTVGMMVRIGALLGVVWLAFPQLQSLRGRLPTVLIVAAIVCLAVAATRPNLGRVVIAMVTIMVSVGGLMKWMSKLANEQPPRRR